MSDATSPVKPARADFWSGLFWIVFGLAIAAYSTTMPIPTHLGATVLTGPGLVPALLGVGLVILGLVLVVRSRGGQHGPDDVVEPGTVSSARALVALVLMVAYATAFALRQPFVPWTIAFVALFVMVFNWHGQIWAARARTFVGALVLGSAVGFIVEFVFETIFYVRLP